MLTKKTLRILKKITQCKEVVVYTPFVAFRWLYDDSGTIGTMSIHQIKIFGSNGPQF